MFRNVERYYQTLKYLRISQWIYLGYYRLIRKIAPVKFKFLNGPKPIENLHPVQFYCENGEVEFSDGLIKFTFLHLSVESKFEELDWNNLSHGKLWSYHLNYFDFLQDISIPDDQRFLLVKNFSQNLSTGYVGLEPYACSLRIFNWVIFLTNNPKLCTDLVLNSLWSQLKYLEKNLEYHIMGNHLLENSFALVLGGSYFGSERILSKGEKLLKEQLKEQLFEDGGHYELSPIYHQIILKRLIQLTSWTSLNRSSELGTHLMVRVSMMISWLEHVTFQNGDVPMVNDSAYGVIPSSMSILNYAKRENFLSAGIKLSDSGYRIMKRGPFELFFDMADIGPDHQPGHAHADSLNFILYFKGKPVILDPSISTYEQGATRNEERGTARHNTIIVKGTNSSDIWSTFRVGKRARTTILTDAQFVAEAEHDGYKLSHGVVHRRKVELLETQIVITDVLSKDCEARSHLHFPPNLEPEIKDSKITYSGLIIKLKGYTSPELRYYSFATGFNRKEKAIALSSKVLNESQIIIKLC